MGQQISKEQIWQALCLRHTEEVQKKLSAARVAVAGLGGLGSHIAFSLARIGVGHLHLIDFDRVELTNLNRQQYRLCHLGRYKTEALGEELLELNPYLHITADCVKVDCENIETLFAEDEIICEAFDRAEEKALLAEGILECFPEKKLVAASGMAGYGDSNRIRTRRIAGNFFLCGDGETESLPGAGLMAPRVALCAAHQANAAVSLILGREPE